MKAATEQFSTAVRIQHAIFESEGSIVYEDGLGSLQYSVYEISSRAESNTILLQ